MAQVGTRSTLFSQMSFYVTIQHLSFFHLFSLNVLPSVRKLQILAMLTYDIGGDK